MSSVDRTGLIPARFVTLISHLVMLIMAMNCRIFADWGLLISSDHQPSVSVIMFCLDINVRACLSYTFDSEEYNEKDRELLIGFVLSLALLGIEMFGFLFGFSMFMSFVGAISVAAHFFACVSLSYWLIDTWDCIFFWWVFVFCSFIPGCIEISIITNMMVVKRIVC